MNQSKILQCKPLEKVLTEPEYRVQSTEYRVQSTELEDNSSGTIKQILHSCCYSEFHDKTIIRQLQLNIVEHIGGYPTQEESGGKIELSDIIIIMGKSNKKGSDKTTV